MNAAAMILVTVLVFAIAAIVIWGIAKIVDWDNARIDAQHGITRDKTGRITKYVPKEAR